MKCVRRGMYLVLIFLILPLYAEQAEFLIIENPAALTVYNRYEQRLSENDKSIFPSYSAWRVLSPDQILSDQFTRTMKVGYQNQVFYFQLSADGTLANLSAAGRIEQIKNARVLTDTILVTGDGMIMRSGNQTQTLSAGILLRRIFAHQRQVFVGMTDSNLSGWISEASSSSWQIYHPDNNELTYEKQIFTKITSVVDRYNLRLQKLFDFLNRDSATRHPVPVWKTALFPGRLICRIDPGIYTGRFPQTRQFMVRELEDLLHGSVYSLTEENRNIVIVKRAP